MYKNYRVPRAKAIKPEERSRVRELFRHVQQQQQLHHQRDKRPGPPRRSGHHGGHEPARGHYQPSAMSGDAGTQRHLADELERYEQQFQ